VSWTKYAVRAGVFRSIPAVFPCHELGLSNECGWALRGK
jgi:hypothetical protein